MSEELWDIGLDGMIGGNGSYVEDDGQVVMHQCMTPEQCCHVVDWLHGRRLEFYLECNSGLYASEHFETATVPAMHIYMKGKGQDKTDLQVREVFELTSPCSPTATSVLPWEMAARRSEPWRIM